MAQNEGAVLPASAGHMSAAGRLANVILEPKAAFTDIAARPGFWVPAILLVVMSLASVFLFSQRVGWERFFRQTAETTPQMQSMTPEQRENTIQIQTRWTAVGAPVGAVIGIAFTLLATSGVMLFIFGTMLGGSVKFKQVLGVVSHAFVPQALFTAATMLVMFLKDPSDFDLKNPAGFNIGFYLDPHATKAWIVSLATSIDVFSIWILLLLATGLSIAAKKSWLTSFFAVIAPWALYVIGKVGWAAIRG